MSKNTGLNKAKKAKNDEFFTLIEDIAKEIAYYVPQLKNKIIYCNCDHENSNFWKFFLYNFNHLQLKKLIATSYSNKESTFKLKYDGKNIVKTPLQQNGDFRSSECIELLKGSDIIITNPPFSLFREYVLQLIEYEKKFLIIGNQNAVTCKDIFPLIKDNKVWLGYSIHSGDIEFRIPNSYENKSKSIRIDSLGDKYVRVSGIRWFTNLDHTQRHEELILYKEYNSKDYPKYDNYNAINVEKTKDIPKDYYEVIGVPITFLDKYNPSQFEIIGHTYSANKSIEVERLRTDKINRHNPILNGKEKYIRLLIKQRS